MPKDISPSHEGREPRSDSPTHDGARSHGKVRNFATRPETYRYAKSDFFTLRSGEQVLRLRGGGDDDANYGDLYNTGWYGDSSNTGEYGGSGWQEDPFRYDPFRYEDLDKDENPFDQGRNEQAHTSDSYSEAIKLLDEWKIKTSYESSEQAIKQLEKWRSQLHEDSRKDASELLYSYSRQMHDDSKEDDIKLFNELRSQMYDDSNEDAIKLFNELRSQICDESGENVTGDDHQRPIDTTTENPIVKLEKEIMHEAVEHGQFFTKDGDLIGDMIVGTASSLDLCSYREMAKDAIFTHNHPQNGQLSMEDLEAAADFNMLEIRAITADGQTFSMARGAKGWKVSKLKEIKKIERDVQGELFRDPVAQKFYQAGNEDAVWKMQFEKIAERIGGVYTVS
jgi:hypothetical protein